MNTSGIVLSIRCWKLAWRNGAVMIPHRWLTFRAYSPSLSRRLESIELMISTIHMSPMITTSSVMPSR